MDKPVVKKDDKTTKISFYTLDDRVEDVVKTEINRIFSNNIGLKKTDENTGIMYTCIKELMVNASKSNIKKTFFIEAKINEKDRDIYNVARKNVKKLMNEHCLPYIQEKLKKHSHKVEVQIENKGNGIVLTVVNSSPLMDDEETKIREVFKKAMNEDTSDIALLYSDDGESNEGAGLGLTLVVNLLKEMGINPAFFRIGVVKNDTVARIEIPLKEDYVSYRG